MSENLVRFQSGNTGKLFSEYPLDDSVLVKYTSIAAILNFVKSICLPIEKRNEANAVDK